jgi:hypothetical protein
MGEKKAFLQSSFLAHDTTTKRILIFQFSFVWSFPDTTSHLGSSLLWLTVPFSLRLVSPHPHHRRLWIPAIMSVDVQVFPPFSFCSTKGCDRQLPLTTWLESWKLVIGCRHMPLVLYHPPSSTTNADNSTNSQMFFLQQRLKKYAHENYIYSIISNLTSKYILLCDLQHI